MFYRLRFVLLVPLSVAAFAVGTTGTATAAPANDNFASAQTLSGTLPITVAGSNVGATAEAGEPTTYSNPASKSVWFKWIPTANVSAVLDLCHADFSGGQYVTPLLAVRSGTTLGSLVSITEINGRCAVRFNATAGVTYNFQVDYYNNEGTFNLTLRQLTPPTNDDFASATSLGSALPVTTNGTTVDSNFQAGEPPSLGGLSGSRSVWYSWTAPSSSRIRLSLCKLTYVDGPLNNTTIVYTGATLGTLAMVSSLTSNDCVMDFPVTAGTTYQIAVSGSLIGEFGFKLKLEAATPPGNDDFANARLLGPGLPVSASGNNDFATTESGEPDHGGYSGTSRSVWFSWTAGRSGPMRIRTCGFDPELTLFSSVYTGSTITGLTEVGERFYYDPCSNFFDAVAGTTYRIAVAGGPFSGEHGPFKVNLHKVSHPGNDNFASARHLGRKLPVSVRGTTVDSTFESNEPAHAGGFGPQSGSVWYRWTAPNDKAAILSACSAGAANRIAVYRQDPEAKQPGIATLIQIDNDAEGCRKGAHGGRLAIAPKKGRTYLIAVAASLPDFESSFTLKITGPSGANPAGFNLKKAIAKCRKIKGRHGKARRKRAHCIRTARKKAVLKRCRKTKHGKARTRCIKSAHKRFK